jgi:hypothetical protein
MPSQRCCRRLAASSPRRECTLSRVAEELAGELVEAWDRAGVDVTAVTSKIVAGGSIA